MPKFLKESYMLFSIMFITVLILNVSTFISCYRSEYTTPWYENSWFKNPVLLSILSFYPKEEYWTMNGDGSEEWLVRDTTVKDKKFWTIIERRKIK